MTTPALTTATLTGIELGLAQASEILIQKTLDQLAQHGIAVGNLVEHQGSVYRLTDIQASVNIHAPKLHLAVWCHGNKKRRDGTFGEYAHSISCPSDLTPIPT